MLNNVFWQTDEVKKLMKQIDNLDTAMQKAVENRKYDEGKRLGMLSGMLADNIDYYVFNAVFPGIIEMLNQYAGKAIGEKTKEKIRNEAKTRFNCPVWLERSPYADIFSVHYSPLDSNGFNSRYARHAEMIAKYLDASGERIKYFDGNKLCPLDVNMFDPLMTHFPFHADPDGDVEKIFSMQKSLREAEDNLNKMINEYNDLLPSGRNSIPLISVKLY